MGNRLSEVFYSQLGSCSTSICLDPRPPHSKFLKTCYIPNPLQHLTFQVFHILDSHLCMPRYVVWWTELTLYTNKCPVSRGSRIAPSSWQPHLGMLWFNPCWWRRLASELEYAKQVGMRSEAWSDASIQERSFRWIRKLASKRPRIDKFPSMP